jgi:hypothetical protein
LFFQSCVGDFFSQVQNLSRRREAGRLLPQHAVEFNRAAIGGTDEFLDNGGGSLGDGYFVRQVRNSNSFELKML